MKPTQDECYAAYKAMDSAKEAHICMVRETISGAHPHEREELNAAAERAAEARRAFDRTMAPCCGSGSMLAT